MNFTRLLLLFIFLPIIELALLLRLGESLGWAATLGIVVVTGISGAVLARWQGLRVLLNIRTDLSSGRMPAPHLLDGLMIIIAAALLVTPGLITDTVGFLLLVPAIRALVRMKLRTYFERKMKTGSIDVTYWDW